MILDAPLRPDRNKTHLIVPAAPAVLPTRPPQPPHQLVDNLNRMRGVHIRETRMRHGRGRDRVRGEQRVADARRHGVERAVGCRSEGRRRRRRRDGERGQKLRDAAGRLEGCVARGPIDERAQKPGEVGC